MFRKFIRCVLLACLAPPAQALAAHVSWAPIVVASAPFRIGSTPAPQGELTATDREPLLVQPLVPLGTVVLDGPVATGVFINPWRMPTGAALFLAAFADGDAYCGVAEGKVTICLKDSTGTGRFDQVGMSRVLPPSKSSGSMFNAMPLIAFPPTKFDVPTATIPYHQAPQPTTPSTTVELRWSPARGPSGQTISLGLGYRYGNHLAMMSTGGALTLNSGASTTFNFHGAIIQIESMNDHTLKYRVIAAMPTHDDKLTATFGEGEFHVVK